MGTQVQLSHPSYNILTRTKVDGGDDLQLTVDRNELKKATLNAYRKEFNRTHGFLAKCVMYFKLLKIDRGNEKFDLSKLEDQNAVSVALGTVIHEFKKQNNIGNLGPKWDFDLVDIMQFGKTREQGEQEVFDARVEEFTRLNKRAPKMQEEVEIRFETPRMIKELDRAPSVQLALANRQNTDNGFVAFKDGSEVDAFRRQMVRTLLSAECSTRYGGEENR